MARLRFEAQDPALTIAEPRFRLAWMPLARVGQERGEQGVLFAGEFTFTYSSMMRRFGSSVSIQKV